MPIETLAKYVPVEVTLKVRASAGDVGVVATSDPAPEAVLDVEPPSLTETSTVVPFLSSNSSLALIGVLSRHGSASRPRNTTCPTATENEYTSTSAEGAGPESDPEKYLFTAAFDCDVVSFGSVSGVADVVKDVQDGN